MQSGCEKIGGGWKNKNGLARTQTPAMEGGRRPQSINKPSKERKHFESTLRPRLGVGEITRGKRVSVDCRHVWLKSQVVARLNIGLLGGTPTYEHLSRLKTPLP